MPITFVDAVNTTLKRVGVIQGDTGSLGTTTGATASEIFTVNSNIQHRVDLAAQLWQEAVQELYSLALMPNLLASATIVTVSGQREYDLPADFERVAGENIEQRAMRGATNGLLLREYQGGYLQMLADQPRATDYVGSPNSYAMSPRAATLVRLDREADASTASETYNLSYEKRIDLTVTMATETLPFSDTVAYALVPVVAEAFNLSVKEEFNRGMFSNGISRAMRMGSKKQDRNRYGRR